MFTGIIEEVGTVKAVQRSSHSVRLTIAGSVIFDDLNIGDSVSVSGVCLTAAKANAQSFTADIMNETLKRSSLKDIKAGDKVNLERAVPLGGRMGGHLVTGHIDGTGIITRICRDGNAVWYTIRADRKILKYIVEKGSVALDGISLTAAETRETEFSVSVIPHSLENTVLGLRKIGQRVNIEADCIGKYVEKLCNRADASGSPLKKFLNDF